MTDLEITKLCAKALKIPHCLVIHPFGDYFDYEWRNEHFDPLHNDAQAMALDEVILSAGLAFVMNSQRICIYPMDTGDAFYWLNADMTKAENRRRARCECVARMQLEQKS